MPDKLIMKLEKERRLVKQKSGFIQVEALLREAILDLSEARKVIAIADRATYILAYMAMLKAGRALLLLKGYRPADGAQHKTVVDVTGVILGKKYSDLAMHFETMRRKRNAITYDAGSLLSPSEAKAAFDDAAALFKEVLHKVRKQNPQINLEFQ